MPVANAEDFGYEAHCGCEGFEEVVGGDQGAKGEEFEGCCAVVDSVGYEVGCYGRGVVDAGICRGRGIGVRLIVQLNGFRCAQIDYSCSYNRS